MFNFFKKKSLLEHIMCQYTELNVKSLQALPFDEYIKARETAEPLIQEAVKKWINEHVRKAKNKYIKSQQKNLANIKVPYDVVAHIELKKYSDVKFFISDYGQLFRTFENEDMSLYGYDLYDDSLIIYAKIKA